MTKSLRRCALCVALLGDFGVKTGQVAHVNRKSSDNREENLCFLCGVHHDEYDRSSRQAKGFLPSELRAHRAALYDLIAHHPDVIWASRDSAAQSGHPAAAPTSQRPPGDIAAFYDRRLRVFVAARDFIAEVTQKVYVGNDRALAYATAVDEATFLFDDSVDLYLHEIYRNAIRLEYLEKRIERTQDDAERARLSQQEYELLVWFPDQFQILRQRMIPFMRLHR
ncbi:MAG: hypothetical protein JO231_17375 [Acidobacteria bacterium]|nr:hypothetical protein [Acidobacteriota bacterium]